MLKAPPPARPPPSHRERGFALLIVLWTIVLLALLVTGITGTGRTEAQLAANLRDNAQLEAEADGAVYDAIFHALATGGGGGIGGETVRGHAIVRVIDEAGLVNPNIAAPPLLQAVLRRVGVPEPVSSSLAAAIADWRDDNATPRPGGAKAPQYAASGKNYGPPEEPFQSIPEMLNVLGMTPDILARLAPHLSVYNEADPNPAAADPVVAAALRDVASGHGAEAAGATVAGAAPAGARTLAITATAIGQNGARFIRRAEIRIEPEDRGPGYRILTWTAPAAAR